MSCHCPDGIFGLTCKSVRKNKQTRHDTWSQHSFTSVNLSVYQHVCVCLFVFILCKAPYWYVFLSNIQKVKMTFVDFHIWNRLA